MDNLIPLADNLLVRPWGRDRVTKSGLIIPESARTPAFMGDVLAAGPGRRGSDMRQIQNPVRSGDRILFRRFSGTEVKSTSDAEAEILMESNQVLAVLGEAGQCGCRCHDKR